MRAYETDVDANIIQNNVNIKDFQLFLDLASMNALVSVRYFELLMSLQCWLKLA